MYGLNAIIVKTAAGETKICILLLDIQSLNQPSYVQENSLVHLETLGNDLF